MDREQDFRTTEDYPQGFVREQLECGHIYRDNIAIIGAEHHRDNAKRRRCEECARAPRPASGTKEPA